MRDSTGRRTPLRQFVAGAVALTIAGCGAGAPAGEDAAGGEAPAVDARDAFFENVAALCGQSFEGATTFTTNEQDPMATARLVMTVESCTDTEIRIPFRVGEDRSRTWILTRSADGLLLKHDHRHEDGTPDEITDYGGWATPDGTPYRQSFPADPFTSELIPEASTNVWTLELDRAGNRFIYDLRRHGQPRFQATFTHSPVSGAP